MGRSVITNEEARTLSRRVRLALHQTGLYTVLKGVVYDGFGEGLAKGKGAV